MNEPLSRYERLQQSVGNVIAPNNFAASDADFFTAGRTVRLRPPFDEVPELAATVRDLGFEPYVIVIRKFGNPPRASALLAIPPETAATLRTELGRMGEEQIMALPGKPGMLNRPGIHWWPLAPVPTAAPPVPAATPAVKAPAKGG